MQIKDVEKHSSGAPAIYDPETVEITLEERVEWCNQSKNMTHTATGKDDPQKFDTGKIAATGDTKSMPISFAYAKVGDVFEYTCTEKGHEKMRGFVKIIEKRPLPPARR